METLNSSPEAATCPACGALNQCAVANNSDTDNCWCRSASIDSAAIARQFPPDTNPVCLCPACAQRISDQEVIT